MDRSSMVDKNMERTTATAVVEPVGWSEVRERLGRFITTRISDAADAEDLLQDVMERAFARLPQLHRIDRLHAWLYNIARNAIVDHYRRAARTPAYSGIDVTQLAAEEPVNNDVADLLSCLEPMLNGLDENDREALLLADRDGLSQKDLSERLGLSYSGAKSRVQRARRKLLDRFEACCALERDSRGAVVDMTPRTSDCRGVINDACCFD
jgi:RNA polymerase sigma-70 factor (ECF subfamily)